MNAVALAPDARTEEALAAGLLATDASRRVGWARAFEALGRVDALEEETRQLRDELRALRRAYSRLMGFVNNIPIVRSPVLDAEFAAHTHAESSFRHQDARDAGVALAVEHKTVINAWSEEDVIAYKKRRETQRSRGQALLRDLFQRARDLGHDPRTAGETVSCPCGFTVERDPENLKAFRIGPKEHAAQVVFGISFAEYEENWQQPSTEVAS